MIVLTGAYGNLGDAVIRRRVLHWVRGIGPVHAYVGNATDDWVEQLGLGPKDNIYSAKDRRRWLRMFFGRLAPLGLVLDPGEVPLARSDLRPELVFLALTLVVRIRGGKIIRPPRGIAAASAMTSAVHRLATRLSHLILWRNAESLQIIRVGRPSPDTGFQEPFRAGLAINSRSVLVVSMRGKREYPSLTWFSAIREIASEFNLRIVLVSQVREDEQRSRDLAERLDAEYLAWGDRSDLEQEGMVRATYESALFVVSDRLHVLVLAAAAGAVPLELADSPTGKVKSHFAQIGVTGVSADSLGDVVVRDFAKAALADRDITFEHIKIARTKLEQLQLEVVNLLSR